MSRITAIVWGLLALLFLSMMVFAGFTLYIQYQEYKAAGSEYDALAEIAHKETVDGDPDHSDVRVGGNDDPDSEPYQCPIDFDALREINPDVVGWIIIDGTTIDYPIVQGPDNAM